jgi:hypothetical protein
MPYHFFTGPANESGIVSLVFADSWLSVVCCRVLAVDCLCRLSRSFSFVGAYGSNPAQQIATVSF